jgi:hypothetical protein
MGVRSAFSRPRLTTSTPLGQSDVMAAGSGTGPRGSSGDTREKASEVLMLSVPTGWNACTRAMMQRHAKGACPAGAGSASLPR